MRSPPASTSRSSAVVAGFQVSISGRFWVSTEGGAAVRAVNDLADEITVSLQTDQGSRTMRDGISTRRWTRLFT
jgi:hypothetical protein